MRLSIALTAILLLLAEQSGAACPDFPGPRSVNVEGPIASTSFGPAKRVPPPRRHVPLPEGPLESVRIRLERSECFGTCPAYSIEISGSGEVRYRGEGYTLIDGDHHSRVSTETARCLLENFKSTDFWSLAPVYAAAVSDMPTAILTLEIGGRSRSLRDYAGRIVGMPSTITSLEEAIDLAGAQPWVVGDSSTVQRLQEEHFDFHSPAAAELVGNAAELDNPEVALAVLAAGAAATGRGFGIKGARGRSAVEAAAAHGRAELVRVLIASGAFTAGEPNLKGRSLRAATDFGDPDTVVEILKQRPEVDVRAEDGTTPLMKVASRAPDPAPPDSAHRESQIVMTLLAAGANARLRDATNSSAMFGRDSAETINLLLRAGAELEGRDDDGDTPLTSVESDDAAMALIAAGADIDATNDKGAGLFAEATEWRWPRTLGYLAAHGQPGGRGQVKDLPWPPDLLDLRRRNFEFHSREAAVMLIRAANEGRDRLLLSLLAAGAPPNQVSSDFRFIDAPSAIIAVSRAGKLDLVRALIKAGAFDDAPYHAREAALIAAAKAARPEVVVELLKTGLDVNALDADGVTALTAVGNSPPDRVATQPKWLVASSETTRVLLAAKADPRLANGRGNTALHTAWSVEVVEQLLQAGADLEARNNDGETPLLATLDDNVAMALIRAGADVTAKDSLGNTVLDNAKSKGLKNTLAYLRAHGLKR